MANLPNAQSAAQAAALAAQSEADPPAEPRGHLAADGPAERPIPSPAEPPAKAAIADPWVDPTAAEAAAEKNAIAKTTAGEQCPSPTPGLGHRFLKGFRSRGWQWLGLGLTLPFLALNGLAAWQVRSLTQYSRPNPQQPPLQYQSNLQRLRAFALGATVPRPENLDNPADLGLAYETRRIDLGQGEQLEAWYVPAQANPATEPNATAPTATEPAATASVPTDSATATTDSAASPDSAAAAKSTAGPAAATSAASSGIQLQSPPPAAAKQGLVLLFPAYAASKQTLLQEIKLLHRLGYSTLAVDYRGVGGSSGNDTTLGLREAEDVSASLDYAGQRFGDRPLVVYSRLLGTGSLLRAIAQRAEAGQPQPALVILENPYDQLFSLTGHSLEAVGLPRSPTSQMLTFWGGVVLGGEAGDRDPITYAGSVTSPTLVLYGTDESWVTLDEVLGVFGLLPGPKEIVGLASRRDRPLSASASGPWMDNIETFLEQHLGDAATP